MDAFDNKRDLTVPMSYPTAARAALEDQVGWDGSPGVVKCGAAYSGKTQQIACSRALESLLEHQKVFLDILNVLQIYINCQDAPHTDGGVR